MFVFLVVFFKGKVSPPNFFQHVTNKYATAFPRVKYARDFQLLMPEKLPTFSVDNITRVYVYYGLLRL